MINVQALWGFYKQQNAENTQNLRARVLINVVHLIILDMSACNKKTGNKTDVVVNRLLDLHISEVYINASVLINTVKYFLPVIGYLQSCKQAQ